MAGVAMTAEKQAPAFSAGQREELGKKLTSDRSPRSGYGVKSRARAVTASSGKLVVIEEALIQDMLENHSPAFPALHLQVTLAGEIKK